MAAAVLDALELAADPAVWRAAGVRVGEDGRARIGDVELRFGGDPAAGAITGWSLRGVVGAIDGLPGIAAPAAAAWPVAQHAPPAVAHPLGTIAVDHVVVATPDLDRSLAAFAVAGLHPRHVRDAGELRQAFFVLQTALAEVVGPRTPAGAAPASFWGLTLVVADLDAAAARLGKHLGPVGDAVQPGRRIATVRRAAGLGPRVALITPRPAPSPEREPRAAP